jgi:hypothetical protein
MIQHAQALSGERRNRRVEDIGWSRTSESPAVSDSRNPAVEPLSETQRIAVGGLDSKGKGIGRVLENGEIEVRVSTFNGRCEYVVTPAGDVTRTQELPASILLRVSTVLAAVGGAMVAIFFVWGPLENLGIVGGPGTGFGYIVLAGLFSVAFGLTGISWSRREDPFLRTGRGRKSLESNRVESRARWERLGDLDLGRADYGDGDGDGDDD